MAAATTLLAAGLGASAIGGAAKTISAAKQKRDARRAARNFRRQELKNVFADQRISTLGAELARDEMARATATTVDALRAGGIRGVVGGVGQVQQKNNETARRIGADLDRQQVQLDRLTAQDDARIRAIQEQRDNMELAALQGQMDAANQQFYSGLGDIGQTAMAFGSSGLFGDSIYDTSALTE